MKLKIIKSTWGMTGSLIENIRKIAEAGYDGIESGIPNPKDSVLFKRLLIRYKLIHIIQIYTAGNDHSKSFIDQYNEAVKWNPVLVVSHSARDCMKFDEQKRFFEKAVNWESKLKIPVAHETHRHRAFYSPWSTFSILKEFPELKICADYSHWCCVCESMLDDQREAIKLASRRTIHIHGRVGYEEGPQVSDPRAPEFERHLKKHEKWWDEIYKIRKNRKDKLFTFTPEFGPPFYQQVLPYTSQPVSDLWEICLWMGKRIRSKYLNHC